MTKSYENVFDHFIVLFTIDDRRIEMLVQLSRFGAFTKGFLAIWEMSILQHHTIS